MLVEKAARGAAAVVVQRFEEVVVVGALARGQ
jgi:predicted aconitase with swiveling domain